MSARAGDPVGPASPVSIAIPTYRRPEGLGRALSGVLNQIQDLDPALAPGGVEVLVIDNDAAGSARATVDSAAHPRVRYAVEASPGVAAVRNRALDETASSALLVFIDDDEEPEPGWLAALLGLHRSTGCQAVAGLVLPAYDTQPDPWVLAGGFFERRTWPTGTPRPVAATNCLLLDLGFVREAGLRFDEAFGATGGEDTLFTRRLTAAGGTILWCDQARVRDHVPVSRLDRRWILRRQRSHAATAVRVDLVLAGPHRRRRAILRGRALTGGCVRVLAGGARRLLGALSGDLRHRARGARLVARGRGMIAAALGRGAHSEYGQR